DGYLRSGYRLGFDADLRDADISGCFQYHTSLYRPHVDRWNSWFQPTPEIKRRIQPAEERLRSSGDTVVGIHIRRGDYGRGYFYLTPVSWYQRWLEEHWESMRRPVLFVSSEDPRHVESFAFWNPQTASSLGARLHDKPLSFYNYKRSEVDRADPQ